MHHASIPTIAYCILTAASKLGMYSGVLALGIGDSMAAMAGKLIGRFKWPGIYCIHDSHVHCSRGSGVVWVKPFN